MKKNEVDRKFDEIVEFAGLENFLETPVKRYSTGMKVRLAVAAHLEPEILIVDEVLAVGDVAFQQKCLGKLQEVSHEWRTILFVSHNLGVMMELCSRAILLHEGEIVASGTTGEVVKSYMSKYSAQTHELVTTTYHEGTTITKVTRLHHQQQPV